MKKDQAYLGGHVSAAGGLKNAVENALNIGANTFQIFGSSPRQWKVYTHSPEAIAEFKEAYKKSGLGPFFLHAPYLINLASPLPDQREKSREILAGHLRIGESIGAKGLIFHIGSGRETEKDEAFQLIVGAMKEVIDAVEGKIMLLVENSAGGGSKIGDDLSELGEILDAVNSPRAGACLDTAHAFEAGIIEAYTPETVAKFAKEIGKTIGWKRLVAIHANDSKTPFNSHSDRHENIGEGYIGLKGFDALANQPEFRKIPWLLEVPGFGDMGPDKKNVDILKKLFRIK